MVYWLALATYQRFFRHVRSPETSPDERTLGLLALFSAAIFVAHPLQTQAVTYIVQRMASLVALFYLLSLALYVQGKKSEHRRWLWWTGSLLSGVLALGVKQNAATLPIAILLYEWFFFQDLSRDWARRQLKALAAITIVLGIMTLLYIGDSPATDIDPAHEAGLLTCLRRGEGKHGAAEGRHEPDFEVEALDELIPILEERFGVVFDRRGPRHGARSKKR